jgi:proteasome lid subunit RPN8/RPN11
VEVEVSNFEIICEKEQMAKIEEHCFSETQIEVGGFLIGKVEEGKTTVTAAVAAKHTIGQSTQLTFTHDTWDAIYKFMEKLPDDEKLIGWYHSHPNFGVFLSEHDQFIQNNFFKSPGQITIVVDPIRGRRGWFTSVDGKIVKHGEEEDTMKKKLGVSSTNADANMDVVLGTRAPSASNLKIIGISALMATLSFVAGLLVNNLSKSNDHTEISVLRKEVATLSAMVQSASLSAPAPIVQGPTTPKVTAPVQSAPKAGASATKPNASPTKKPLGTLLKGKTKLDGKTKVASNPLGGVDSKGSTNGTASGTANNSDGKGSTNGTASGTANNSDGKGSTNGTASGTANNSDGKAGTPATSGSGG